MFQSKFSRKNSYDIEKKASSKEVNDKFREKTKLLLPSSWSGIVTVDDRFNQQDKCKNFSMGLWNLDPQSKFRGVIFRNTKPIEGIRPYQPNKANKDALRSLKSLDNRLQREIQNIHSSDSIDEDNDDLDSSGEIIYSSRSCHQFHDFGNDEHCSAKAHRSGTIREFDVTMISPRAIDINTGIHDNSKSDAMLSRKASITTLSSLKLNLNSLDSSRLRDMALLKPGSHQRTSSIGTEFSDAYSLVSSTGSLMFMSRQSRIEAYDAIKSPRYEDEQLVDVSKLLRRVSEKEGRKRNNNFQFIFSKLCDIVNAIIETVPANILPFRIKKIEANGNYETIGDHSFEFYMVPEISGKDIDVQFQPTSCNLADIFLTGNNQSLEIFAISDPITGKRKLSPCKLMIVFAHILNATVKTNAVDGMTLPHNSSVLFENISEKEIRISVTFPESDIRYEVSMVLAIDIDAFPIDAVFKKGREWPNAMVKQQVARKGVHLTSKTIGKDLHSWHVTFLKSRRALLQLTDETGNKLRLLLVLQCLRETELSSPDAILPCHFATILFWANVKYRVPIEWTTVKLGKRFIDLVVALRRCLWKRECFDFFVPNVNMFENLKIEDCHELSLKIDMLIRDPVAYLESRLM